jgi:hypothetical protein
MTRLLVLAATTSLRTPPGGRSVNFLRTRCLRVDPGGVSWAIPGVRALMDTDKGVRHD